MSIIPSALVQIGSWAGGHIFYLFHEKLNVSFWYILEYYKFGVTFTVCIRGFVLRLSLYLSNRVWLCSSYGFLCYTFNYFVPFGVFENKVIQVYSKYFNGTFVHFVCPDLSILFLYAAAHKAWLFEKSIFELDASSYSFKTTCILLRQVTSLKKMLLSSAKFIILISWSPICIPLILLLALMKLAITSAAIMYSSMDNNHLCQNPRVWVNGSGRTPSEWICLHIWTYGKQKS